MKWRELSKSRSARLIALLAIAGGLAYFAFEPEGQEPARPVKRTQKKGTARIPWDREPVMAVVPVLTAENISTSVETHSRETAQGSNAQSNLLATGEKVAVQNFSTDNQGAVSEPPEVSGKAARYSKRLLEKYDRDHSGKLERTEWSALRGDPREADFNGDGVLTLQELTFRVESYGRSRRTRLVVESGSQTPTSTVPGTDGLTGTVDNGQAKDKGTLLARRNRKFSVPQSRLPQGLPEWFLDRDADGDGQLTLSEFAPSADPAQKDEFMKLDLNNDGLVTAAEYIRAVSAKPVAKPAAAAEKVSQ